MGKEKLYRRGVKIDDRNRVVIQAELLEELGLKIGDLVCVYANFNENKIIIKKQGLKK